ncbi:MAG: antitoxin family protein [Desulfurococcales archaeon]|nr:antitoxin family protein [Desulfurococcales archaeon]
MLKPLEPLEFREREEVLVKVIAVEERRRLLRKHRGALSCWRPRSSNAIPIS